MSECNYSEALSLFEAGLKIRKKIQNNYVAASHVLLGMNFIFMKEYVKAEIELDECARLCKEAASRLNFLKAL